MKDDITRSSFVYGTSFQSKATCWPKTFPFLLFINADYYTSENSDVRPTFDMRICTGSIRELPKGRKTSNYVKKQILAQPLNKPEAFPLALEPAKCQPSFSIIIVDDLKTSHLFFGSYGDNGIHKFSLKMIK